MYTYNPDMTMMENANLVLQDTGLARMGWTWHWNTNKTRAGVCKYGPRRLELSSVVASVLTPEDTWNTVLHEVAHALTPYDKGHGKTWRFTFKDLGGNGQTTTALNEEAAERLERMAKWIGECPNDPAHNTTRERLTRQARTMACGECAPVWLRENIYIWRENASRVLAPVN